jgi:hypothetical protein
LALAGLFDSYYWLGIGLLLLMVVLLLVVSLGVGLGSSLGAYSTRHLYLSN